MKLSHLTLVALTAAACVSSAKAAVVISEVLYNEVGSVTAGEFFEIYNNGNAAVDLSGYKVGDIETAGKIGEGGGMLQFPAGTSIAPGQVYTVAAGAVYFQAQYGFNPDFDGGQSGYADPSVPQMTAYTAWDADGGPFAMANGGDQAILLDGNDAVVDMVNWASTVAMEPIVAAGAADGQSLYRLDPTTDTDTAADWAYTPNPTGTLAAARSTPGVVPSAVPEPASLAVLGLAAAAGLRRRR